MLFFNINTIGKIELAFENGRRNYIDTNGLDEIKDLTKVPSDEYSLAKGNARLVEAKLVKNLLENSTNMFVI